MPTATRSEFSHRTRAYNLARLRAEMFDVLVIGAGIMGAGIAREAALRGYKVALVEKDDFASGATSQSSQLVNFDIGDLESSRFDRLYQAGQEQRRLLPLSPNHISSFPIVLPTYVSSRHDPSLINLGLWMYDGLPLARGESRHQFLTKAQITAQTPHLDLTGIVGGVRYFVSRTNGARLTLENVRSAHNHKAVVVNHLEVRELTRTTGKRIDGIGALDLLSEEYVQARARIVVNATGAWTAQLLALDGSHHVSAQPLVKRIHVLTQRKKFPLSEGIAFRPKSTPNWMFALPKGDYVLFGPCEREYSGSPDNVRATAAEVDEVLKAISESFQHVRIDPLDLLSTFAEVRPAPAGKGDRSDDLGLEREIRVTASGLVNAPAGDLTTHRTKAQHLVSQLDKVLARDFGVHSSFPSRSATVPLVEVQGDGKSLTVPQSTVLASLSPLCRERIEQAYGLRQSRVLDYALGDPKLLSPIVDGLQYIWAEVPHAVEQEMAMTVADVMMRRLDLFHELQDGAVVPAREIARYMSRMFAWFDSDIEQQVAHYAETVRLNRESLRRLDRPSSP